MIDLLSSFKKTSQFAFSSPIINGLLGSSLFLGAIIAVIMILIIMVLYPAKPGTPFSIVCKMFIYMFLSSVLLIFIHDGIIKYMHDEQNRDQDSESFMRGIEPGNKDIYNLAPPVAPNLNQGLPVSQVQPTGQPPTQSQAQSQARGGTPTITVVEDANIPVLNGPRISGGYPNPFK